MSWLKVIHAVAFVFINAMCSVADLCTALSRATCGETNVLLTLPTELLVQITKGLQVRDVTALRRTHGKIRELTITYCDDLARHVQNREHSRLSSTIAKLNFAGLPIHVAAVSYTHLTLPTKRIV